MSEEIRFAPGWPGIAPRWTSSAKQGVGSSLNPASRVWFSVSHGIFNEIYYPRVDQACTRDMGMIITSDDGFFSEEKRSAEHKVSTLASGVPAYALSNTSVDGRYRIDKEVLTDPWREVLLQNTRFTALTGALGSYRLYLILSPHIANRGWGNTGWLGDYKGVEMLFAQREGTCLALACSCPWLRRSVGFVGSSDGWQDLSRNKRLTAVWDRAENGNIALTAEVDLASSKGEFAIALGFGGNAAEAGNRALASLADGFDHAKSQYIAEWQQWQERLSWRDERPRGESGRDRSADMLRTSTAIIHAHEAKNFPGGMIASLSVPWGFSKGDDDLGGYHLVWPRDLVETAGGILASGGTETVARVLHYLQSTQEPDGHWPQNMWLDGTPYWPGIQMDETAFPILLVDLAMREKAIDAHEQTRMWSMVRRAASFIVQNGPVTQQDRWEEDPGYSPFTLAVEIAALLCAADMADARGEAPIARYLRETADSWNDAVERWIYAVGTDLARKLGVEGYYVRISPPEVADAPSPAGGFVPIKNRPPGQGVESATHIVSVDALALVRFGLRAADDPRIVNTVRAIDSLLKVETPSGPAWHRYNDDGYGEHADGSPFDGTGTGRAWPLITGERAHYELAAGRKAEAEKLCRAMEAFAGDGGLIPEQVWDSPDIPERELFFGKPSGSAMPLLWAHAEYIKLRRSITDGKVFDMPPQTVKRYIVNKTHSPYANWRLNQKCRLIPVGKTLRVELLQAAQVHWSTDEWKHAQDTPTKPTGLGVHVADIPTGDMPSGTRIVFTLRWAETGSWEGTDFRLEVSGG
jgi:glucoamylase